MNKLKIIIFIDWFLPGIKAGGPVKSISNLVTILKHKFDFYIITGDRDMGDKVPFENIELNKWHKKDGINVLYLSKLNQNKKEYLYQINFIDPDIIYINGIFSFHFSIIPLLVANKLKIKTIVAPRGMLGDGALSIKPIKKKIFLKLADKFNIYKNVIWHATDQSENNEIIKIVHTKTKIFVIPNVPVKPLLKASQKIKTSNSLKLVYISRISKKKNLSYLLELLLDSSTLNNIELDIWGPIEDEVYFDRCNTLIKSINSNQKNKVLYRGDLKWNEIESAFLKYDFFILPTLHENFGHAIFESFAYGVPVIISDNTPWRNLHSMNIGFDINLKNKTEWLNALSNALEMNNDQYMKYSENCILFANQWLKDQNLIEKYSELFNLTDDK